MLPTRPTRVRHFVFWTKLSWVGFRGFNKYTYTYIYICILFFWGGVFFCLETDGNAGTIILMKLGTSWLQNRNSHNSDLIYVCDFNQKPSTRQKLCQNLTMLQHIGLGAGCPDIVKIKKNLNTHTHIVHVSGFKTRTQFRRGPSEDGVLESLPFIGSNASTKAATRPERRHHVVRGGRRPSHIMGPLELSAFASACTFCFDPILYCLFGPAGTTHQCFLQLPCKAGTKFRRGPSEDAALESLLFIASNASTSSDTRAVKPDRVCSFLYTINKSPAKFHHEAPSAKLNAIHT